MKNKINPTVDNNGTVVTSSLNVKEDFPSQISMGTVTEITANANVRHPNSDDRESRAAATSNGGKESQQSATKGSKTYIKEYY